MAKKSYIGDSDNLSKLIPNIGYYGDSQNKSKRLLKGYVGNAQNKAKLFWEYITGITRVVFNRGYGFYSSDFTIYETITNGPLLREHIKYGLITIDNVVDKLLIDNLFTYYNVVESENGAITTSNPIYYHNWYAVPPYEYDELVIPAESSDWVYIPTFIMKLRKLVFEVATADSAIIKVGIATRTSDDEKQAVTKTITQELVSNTSKNITIAFNDERADYLVFGVEGEQGQTPSFSIRYGTATFDRCYGVIYALSQAYYLNFPRYAFVGLGSHYDYSISAAESAVYMVVFNTTNQYTSKIYTDVDAGDGFADGTTYFLFIAKKAFSLSYITEWGPDNTVNSTSVTLDNKVTHYILRTYTKQVSYIYPFYNYAYSYYDGQTLDSSKIALIGKECLYDNVIQ